MPTTDPNSAKNQLATETWDECFNYLDISDLKSLSRTCRYFYDVCSRLICRRVDYYLALDRGRDGDFQIEEINKNVYRVLTLSTSVHAPLVRELSLRWNYRIPSGMSESVVCEMKSMYPLFVKTIVKMLPCFSNLRAVGILFRGKVMDKVILEALAALPQLDELGFREVKFGAHQLTRDARIKVRTLRINNEDSDCNLKRSSNYLDVFSGERLESLSIISRVYSPKIMLSLARLNSCNLLKSLTIATLDPNDFSIFLSFLKCCPGVELLELFFGKNTGPRASLNLPNIPNALLRRLESFHGYHEAARVFVPGRPVQKVYVHDGGYLNSLSSTYVPRDIDVDMEILLLALSQSTGPVIDLRIDFAAHSSLSQNSLASITTRTPSLSSLWLEMDNHVDLLSGEDPFSYDLGVTIFDATDSREDSRLLPLQRHAKYMRVMHLIALKKRPLPRNLVTLYVKDGIFYMPSFYDGFHFMNKRDSETDEDRYGRAYTISMATSIFATISEHYPALREVQFIGDEYTNFFWYKARSGSWKYSGHGIYGDASFITPNPFDKFSPSSRRRTRDSSTMFM